MVVEYHMELWTDVARGKVPDCSHQRRVRIREANELPLSCSTIPLRDFLAILKARVQHINRAAPNVRSKMILVIASRASQYFQRREPAHLVGNAII